MSFAWGRFSKKQLDSIRNSTARLNIWEGAVRSGKTIASVVRWLDFLATGPPGDLLMAGKTERTLRRNILNPLEEILGPRLFRYNAGEGEAFICGRRVYVAGANDERAENKIRGMTLAGAYGDEVTLWPESFFRMLTSRLSVPGAKFFGTTNPDSPFHWLKTEYLDREGLDLKAWHFVLEDNLNLDPEFVANLKREYTGLWYKRFILGLWVQAEGAVYDMWDEARHVVREIPHPHECDRLIAGGDYGTANPTTLQLIGRYERRWYVLREYYFHSRDEGRQKTDAQYADDVEAWLGDVRDRVTIYLDPAAASFILQLRRRGLHVVEADNSVLEGIQLVSRLLAEENLLVHESCTHLRREFASYVWDPKAQQRGEDKPLKRNDHALDSVRYALYTHLQNPPLDDDIREALKGVRFYA
ncbi:PBSX family phage terminase large subunit [Alicyclobacillus macrosporangiidus]|jgi:PBSX family phage terminase large subunit|uniref:Phage terminase, large subunit, PBSX family n=1 Tax=Alicyclobacillus macrosporangiidus TaxID=392015 RepID=A0A1I7FV55_9BACL|nr:PBSX family phage terminase large subunit [Alicyclobacillus macrosporangiidus]SFU40079.1 phage terminase, large subunit, PBSX family [Alicyclobacillus macrosporangiidus]